MGVKYLAFPLLVAAVLIAGTSYAAVDIEVGGSGRSYGPGTKYLDANLTVSYTELIPRDNAMLYTYFNNENSPRGEVRLYNYLHDESYYTFQNQTFSYNITASGDIIWYEYPEQYFWYIVSVTGLCGGEWCHDNTSDWCGCPCETPYPCSWSISRTSFREDTINGNPELTGLKFIENASASIGIPLNTVPGSVVWNVMESASNPDGVEVTMRAACGLMSYDNTDPSARDGWITKQITPAGGCPCTEIKTGVGNPPVLEGTNCTVTVDHFDDASMAEGYRKYGGPWYPSGGVYKDGEYQRWGTDVEWNGTSGEIILKNFDSNAYYSALYLPPNGPMVCAYTSHRVQKSSAWSGSYEVTGASAGYLEPYTRTYFNNGLNQSPYNLEAPDCPIPPEYQHMCDKSEVVYGAVESYDPSDSVDVSYDYNAGTETLTVTGTADKKILSGEESFRVNLSLFNIDISDFAKDEGSHTMTVVITDGETSYGEESFTIFTCADGDGDGYCTEDGDCNDTDPGINPGMDEACNGVDDDCNGIIDDGIAGMGENLGKPCWDWPGSACRGVYVCNASGTGLVCKPDKGISPGDMEEICDNYMDDDCDTYIDEKNIYISGVLQTCLNVTMICYEGETRPCGPCRDGLMSCVDGKWDGPCIGASEPKVEVCNRADDDCDGTVDNIYGKGSVDETKCQCYGGELPRLERCNGIDDDCDGEIDEGAANCCDEDETRACGTDEGRCEFGIQTCHDGQFGPCTGAVLPELEVCCNGEDDDCDGRVDEDCGGAVCKDGDLNDMSMFYWTMIGIGVVMLIGVLVYMEFLKKKPA
jgi:hypothetical protein